jgi:hypothetical protein
MDLDILITNLTKERERLDEVITALTELRASVSTHAFRLKSRRGRKFMPVEERQMVSQRIKAYWAARRQARGSVAW